MSPRLSQIDDVAGPSAEARLCDVACNAYKSAPRGTGCKSEELAVLRWLDDG